MATSGSLLCCNEEKAFDIAESNIAKAIDEIEGNTLGSAVVRGILLSEKPPEEEKLKALQIDPVEKALLCIVLSHRFPEQSQAFKALAPVYNFSPTYPHLLIRKWSRLPAENGLVQLSPEA